MTTKVQPLQSLNSCNFYTLFGLSYSLQQWSVDKADTAPEDQGLLCRIRLKSTAFDEIKPEVCQETKVIETNEDQSSNSESSSMEHDRQMLHDFFLEDEVDEEEEEEFEDLGSSSNEVTEPMPK